MNGRWPWRLRAERTLSRRDPIDRRAGCGKTARPVRREGWRTRAIPTPIAEGGHSGSQTPTQVAERVSMTSQTGAPNNPKGIAASSPRLACNAYLGCALGNRINANGVVAEVRRGRERMGLNRVAVGDVSRTMTQGSSCLATLGSGTESRWDSRTERDSASRSRFTRDETALAVRRHGRNRRSLIGHETTPQY